MNTSNITQQSSIIYLHQKLSWCFQPFPGLRVVELNATAVGALPVVQATDGFPMRLEGRVGLDPGP